MAYIAEALARTRQHAAWNFTGGRMWTKPPAPGPIPDTDEATIDAIARSLPKLRPTIPQAILDRLGRAGIAPGQPGAGVFATDYDQLGRAGIAPGQPGAVGPAVRYLGEPIIQSIGIGPSGVGDDFFTIAKHTAWATLDTIHVRFTPSAAGEYIGKIGFWLVPEYLEGDPLDDPRNRPDAINLTPGLYNDPLPPIWIKLPEANVWAQTIRFDKAIPWIPYSVIVHINTQVFTGVMYAHAITKLTPTLPQDIRVRIPTSPIVINRTTITAQLPAPAPPAAKIYLSMPSAAAAARPIILTAPQAPTVKYPRGVITKVTQSGRVIYSQTVAWPSLDPELKAMALNAMLSGTWPATMEPIW